MRPNYNEEFKNAIEQYQNNNYDNAKSILKMLIATYPDKVEPYFWLGKIETEFYHNINKAIELFLKAVDILPFYEGYKELTLCYMMQRNHIKALEYAKKALIYNSQCTQMLDIINKVFPKEKNFVRIKEIVINDEYESSKDCTQLKYSKIYDAGVIDRKPPIYIDELLSENQKKLLTIAMDQTRRTYYNEGFVVKIPDGRAFIKQSDQTFIITPDNKILKDMLVEGCPELSVKTMPNEVRVADKMLVLSSCWGGNYYHWLTWTIPRLHMIKAAGYNLKEFDKILINYHGFKFQQELLELIGIQKHKIVATTPYGAVLRAKTLVTASLPSHLSTPQIVTDSLRSEFLKPASFNDELPKRIYLSRNKSASRFVLNEDKVIAYLKSLDFAVIYVEEHTFEQQVQLFANADFIISQHGAGLINLTFCKPGTKVIEIYNENFRNNIDTGYFRICANLQLDHYFMFGEPDFNVNPLNMTIDLIKLTKVIDLASSHITLTYNLS